MSRARVWPHRLDLPAGHDAQQAVRDAHVPVRLGSGGDLVGAEGPVVPYGVDLGHGGHEEDHAGHEAEVAGGLDGTQHCERQADDVVLGPARPGYCVPVPYGQSQPADQHGDDQGGDDQCVQGAEAGDQVLAGNSPPKRKNDR